MPESPSVSHYTIFNGPEDFPGECVVRRFKIFSNEVTPDRVVWRGPLGAIEDARDYLRDWHPGLHCISRNPFDPKSIVETWI